MDVEILIRTLKAEGRVHTYGDGKDCYGVFQLWVLCEQLPTEELAFGELGPKLEYECWGAGLSPKMVLEAGGREHESDWRRIMEADLTYPLLVTEEGMHVVDGMHRLSRCHLEGRARVLVRRVPPGVMRQAAIAK